MKLSREALKAHRQAEEYLEGEIRDHERWYILDNWSPNASDVQEGHAFFTPHATASALAQDSIDGGKLLDLGGGIGMLSFHHYHSSRVAGYSSLPFDFTIVEKNERFVEVGRKILPFAKWIVGSIYDEALIRELGYFDCVVSNPPFGGQAKVPWLASSGAAIMALEVALTVSNSAVFILPQVDPPWKYNNNRKFEETRPSTRMGKFLEKFPSVAIEPSNFSDGLGGFEHTGTEIEIVKAHTTELLHTEQLTLTI